MDQRDVDKAHGAVGMARRVVDSLTESVARLDDKIEKLAGQLTDAQAAREAAAAELEEARTALAVTETSPLLRNEPSHGGATGAPADPALGEG